MSKHERKREKKAPGWIPVICLLLVVGLLALFVVPRVLNRANAEPDMEEAAQAEETPTQAEAPADHDDPETPAKDEPAETPKTAVAFPVALDEGNIEIESLFSFNGVNPDANKQDAADVASILLKNASGKYLREAAVKIMLDGGTELLFLVNDIPVGADVMAFSVNNDRLLVSDLCVGITVDAMYEDTPHNSGVEIAVDGMMVTVTNTSTEDVDKLDVYYRDVFDDKYFGGMAYKYTIEELSAGENTTFAAGESLLGMVDVVRVAVNDKN